MHRSSWRLVSSAASQMQRKSWLRTATAGVQRACPVLLSGHHTQHWTPAARLPPAAVADSWGSHWSPQWRASLSSGYCDLWALAVGDTPHWDRLDLEPFFTLLTIGGATAAQSPVFFFKIVFTGRKIKDYFYLWGKKFVSSTLQHSVTHSTHCGQGSAC